MPKELKVWNGRAHCCQKRDDPFWEGVAHNTTMRAYIAAYSRADACRLIGEYCGAQPSDSELKNYWSEGAWGNSMAGIKVERGLWISLSYAAPVRVF